MPQLGQFVTLLLMARLSAWVRMRFQVAVPVREVAMLYRPPLLLVSACVMRSLAPCRYARCRAPLCLGGV